MRRFVSTSKSKIQNVVLINSFLIRIIVHCLKTFASFEISLEALEVFLTMVFRLLKEQCHYLYIILCDYEFR